MTDEQKLKGRMPLPERVSYYSRRGLLYGNAGSTDKTEFVVNPQPENFQRFIDEEWNKYQVAMNRYYVHKLDHPEYYEPTYQEANMSHRFLLREFKPTAKMESPYNNWFGVSVYLPDVVFIRGNKKIHLSLQGMCMPMPSSDNQTAWELIKARSARYVCFEENGEKIYETWGGEIPTHEFIENFIQP